MNAPACLTTCWQRFRRDRGGASAIEFAIIGPVFFLLILAVLQICLWFFAQHNIQNAVTAALRDSQVRSSQSNSPATTADVSQEVQARVSGFVGDALEIVVNFEALQGQAANDPGSMIVITARFTSPIQDIFGVGLPEIVVERSGSFY